jgi:hypothetical protein
MKTKKNIPIIAVSTLAVGYGVVKLVQLKNSDPKKISENDKMKAGTALLVGLFGLGVGFIGFNKA